MAKDKARCNEIISRVKGGGMIAVYNLENKYKNLALEKVKKFYTDKGEIVVDYLPLNNELYGKVYVSSMFNFTPKPFIESNFIVGGTGFDLTTKLPTEIEAAKPKLNFGFTTRGCIRKCKFCVVPQKEGELVAVGDIYDIWDGRAKEITLLDNNILGLPKHAEKILKQIKKENLRLSENGLDVRLLDDGNCKLLSDIRHEEYKLAWDGDDDLTAKFEYVFDKLGQCRVYVLCGILPFERIMQKLEVLKAIGHNAYVMRLDNVRSDKLYISLSRWVNQARFFKAITFEQFTQLRANI